MDGGKGWAWWILAAAVLLTVACSDKAETPKDQWVLLDVNNGFCPVRYPSSGTACTMPTGSSYLSCIYVDPEDDSLREHCDCLLHSGAGGAGVGGAGGSGTTWSWLCGGFDQE